VWRQANKYKVPRIAFVNKMDRMGADFFTVVKQVRERLGANAVPLQIPIGSEADFKGIVDLVTMKAYVFSDAFGKKPEEIDCPPELLDLASEWREKLVEAAAEVDDELIEKFLGGEPLTNDEIRAALRKGTIDMSIVPMICGSAYKNKGVQQILDAVLLYLPSPLDKGAVPGINPETEQEDSREPSDEAPFSALAFKLTNNQFGNLTFFRVYSGALSKGSYVYNATTGKKERLGRILQMHANKSEEIDVVYAGDIAAAVGLSDTTTGDTLADEKRPIVLEAISFPEPVIEMSIEPKTKVDQDKMGQALARLSAEDPTFKMYTDQETGQTIIRGMGELHLEIIVDRMKREFKVEANQGKPQVAYRETIRVPARAQGLFKKQTGGRGKFGDCTLEIEPNETGAGYEFINKVVGGAIPKEFIPAVDKGVQDSLHSGVLAGFPVVDVKVTVVDGSFHEVDSDEISFREAGRLAFRSACQKAQPVIKEPIMTVEVVTPDQFLGDVIGDLNRRRGVVEGQETGPGGTRIIKAKVPLAEMFGYVTTLRSMTQGRASSTMEPSHYEEVPRNVAEEIMAKNSGKVAAAASR
jgi:elongation factor G